MFYWFLAVSQCSCFVVFYMYMLALPFDAMKCSCSIYFCCLKVCVMNLFSALLYFSLSFRICYDLLNCLDDCHWTRGYMGILSNHVLPYLTCTSMTCFCLICSCTVASLFHASNMSTCYSCSHVCPVFHCHNLCYKVAFCIDHIGLILMPMNLKLDVIWSM